MESPLLHVQSLLEQPNPQPNEALIELTSMTNGEDTPWPVFHFIGLAWLLKREHETALVWLNKAVKTGDDEAISYHAISICHYATGDFKEAEKSEKKALEKEDFYAAWMHLAAIYRDQAKLKDALHCFQQAAKIQPENTGITSQLADIYRNNGRLDKALELLDSMADADGQNLSAYISIAEILIKKMQFDEAKECLDFILQEEPENKKGNFLLSHLFRQKGDYEKALEVCEEALKKNPASEIRINYAICLQELGKFDEAERNYLRVLKKHPEIYQTFSNYLMCIHYNPAKSKQEIFEAHKQWDQYYAPKKRPKSPVPINKNSAKKLRIGLISGGFQRHPVGWMITGSLKHLPSDQFEIYCYTTSNRYDEITNRISEIADRWRSVVGYSDKTINRIIRDDEIDILIELSGHAVDNRLRTVALKPAPVIVKWVGGLFNTSGLQAIDFLITDQYESPAGEDKFYTEKLVRMPDDYISYLPPKYIPDVEPPPVKENEYITFGCFNNPSKINEEILTHWAKIMGRVPESRLMLKSKQYDTDTLTKRIISKMKQEGVAKERLIFKGQSSHNDHLSYYNKIDIALDPWPYSGGLTTCEALYMGVPVITKPGPTFAGRHSTTHLANAGFSDWVTDSWDEYIEKSVALAENIEQLTSLRSTMRKQVANSPLCNGRRFAAHLSLALREMWKQRVSGYESRQESAAVNGWQDHITVKELTKEEIEKYSVPSRITMDEANTENESNIELSTTEKVAHNGEASTSPKHWRESATRAPSMTQISRPSPARLSDNERSKQPESGSHQRAEEKPDAFKIETKDGVTICTPPDLNLLTPYVLLEQEQWFEPELDFVRAYLKPGMNVLDIGAGFGAYSLPMAKLAGKKGTVYAFEPGAAACRHLENSKSENHFDNLHVVNRAVAGRSGSAKLRIADTPELNKVDENGTEKIAQSTLDDWWQYTGKYQVDFIKIDVNGAEADVLDGAQKLFAKESPVILIAVGEGSQKDIRDIENKLADKGYGLYEYVQGLQLLTGYDSREGLDSYRMNLIAIKNSSIDKFKKQNLLFDDNAAFDESENETWKDTLRKMPWTESVFSQWKEQADEPQNEAYLKALDYFCRAEEIDCEKNPSGRSKKGALMLKAVKMLVRLYNDGNRGIPVSLTLARGLNLLGKREQAVEVMKTIMETNTLAEQDVNIDIPFLLPLPEQDQASIQTEFKKWLTVRIVEAWLLLKNVSSYFSGEEELELLNKLEGNPEISPAFKRMGNIEDSIIRKESGKVQVNQYNTTEKERLKKIDKLWYQTTLRLIHANRPNHIKNHHLPNELVVSLTSYPERFSYLPLTLLSLCNQSVKPDRITLWIARKDKKSLTPEIKSFRKNGVEIEFCEDIKSYKKIIPTLKKYPESYIVTADDDLYYRNDWLENLVQRWANDDKSVVANRVHRIKLKPNGKPRAYHEWGWQYRDTIEPSALNFPTGGSGALYPPNIFHPDVTRKEIFTDLAPNADDVWLYWMARLAGAKTKITKSAHPFIEWTDNGKNTLWKDNILKAGNDKQIKNLIQKYGFPKIDEKQRKPACPSNNFAGSKEYWRNRYKTGGNSGDGSYGQLAQFKAKVINSFTKENNVNSFIEFGCGDGNQLKYLTLPKYVGYDVSDKALEICRKKFQNDFKKEFKKIEVYNGEMAECALSIDVIFHLVEDEIFSSYMERLFKAAEKYVVIYSSNKESYSQSPHVRHRLFSLWIETNTDDWQLKKHIPNKYPYNGNYHKTSFCDFYIYEKKTVKK